MARAVTELSRTTFGARLPEQYVNVSPREKQCLVWGSRGKTAYETGIILGTSERTVRFHWENLIRKFDTHGKVETIVKAIKLGVLTP